MALSVAPEQLRGDTAPIEHQAISGFVTRTERSEADLTVAFVYIMFATGIARS